MENQNKKNGMLFNHCNHTDNYVDDNEMNRKRQDSCGFSPQYPQLKKGKVVRNPYVVKRKEKNIDVKALPSMKQDSEIKIPSTTIEENVKSSCVKNPYNNNVSRNIESTTIKDMQKSKQNYIIHNQQQQQLLPEISEKSVSMAVKDDNNTQNTAMKTNINGTFIDNDGINYNWKQSSNIDYVNNSWDTKYNNDSKELQNNQKNDISTTTTSPSRSKFNSINTKNENSTVPLMTSTKTMTTATAMSSSSQVKTTISSSTTTATAMPKYRLPSELEYDEKRIQQVDDEYRLKLIKNANMKSTLKNGWKLLPHQKSGVLKSLLMRRLVLAFDMGLGQ